jgi:hypothetical protein
LCVLALKIKSNRQECLCYQNPPNSFALHS